VLPAARHENNGKDGEEDTHPCDCPEAQYEVGEHEPVPDALDHCSLFAVQHQAARIYTRQTDLGLFPGGQHGRQAHTVHDLCDPQSTDIGFYDGGARGDAGRVETGDVSDGGARDGLAEEEGGDGEEDGERGQDLQADESFSRWFHSKSNTSSIRHPPLIDIDV